jgi:hypothetical protein
MRVMRTRAAILVIAGCGTNAPTQEHRDPPTRRRALFVCYADIFEHRRCYATPAEDLAKWDHLKDAKVADRAWCVATPARLDTNGRMCFISLDDCTKRARMDPLSDGLCAQQDAAVALIGVYGKGDVH